MKSAVIRLVCLAAVALATVGVRAEKFSAGGISFEGPKGWLSQKPSSSMRKAQFAVKGKDGKSAEVVFFHFGPGAAGGVKANVQRWLGQFKEPADKLKAKISDETIDGTKVTYVTAEGTFMKGPPLAATRCRCQIAASRGDYRRQTRRGLHQNHRPQGHRQVRRERPQGHDHQGPEEEINQAPR